MVLHRATPGAPLSAMATLRALSPGVLAVEISTTLVSTPESGAIFSGLTGLLTTHHEQFFSKTVK